MRLSLTNIFQFISSLSPLLLSFYLIMNSIVNNNLKGLIYLVGALLATCINIIFMEFIESPRFKDEARICRLINIPFMEKSLNMYNSPAINSMFIAFTINYLYLPMIDEKTINYSLLFVLLSLFGIDSISQIQNRCTNSAGVALGGFIGLALGYVWYAFVSSRDKNLVYLNTQNKKKLYKKKIIKKNYKMY